MTTSSASKKGLLLVLAAALLLSIGGLCVKMIPWQPLSHQRLPKHHLRRDPAGLCQGHP